MVKKTTNFQVVSDFSITVGDWSPIIAEMVTLGARARSVRVTYVHIMCDVIDVRRARDFGYVVRSKYGFKIKCIDLGQLISHVLVMKLICRLHFGF